MKNQRKTMALKKKLGLKGKTKPGDMIQAAKLMKGNTKKSVAAKGLV